MDPRERYLAMGKVGIPRRAAVCNLAGQRFFREEDGDIVERLFDETQRFVVARARLDIELLAQALEGQGIFYAIDSHDIGRRAIGCAPEHATRKTAKKSALEGDSGREITHRSDPAASGSVGF
jgi:hypothetical protein